MFGKFIYHILAFNFIRLIFFGFCLFFGFIIICFGKMDGTLQEKVIYTGLFLLMMAEFARQYYINNKKSIHSFIGFFCETYNFIIRTFKVIFKIGSHTSRFLVNVKEGVYQDKWKLHQERKEFENEKAWFEDEKRKLQEENDKIMRAWEDVPCLHVYSKANKNWKPSYN